MNEKKIGREKLNQVEVEWRGKLSSLESQLAKQRQRAMDLVAERENELADLRASLIPSTISSDKVVSTKNQYMLKIKKVSFGGHYNQIKRGDVFYKAYCWFTKINY